MNRRDFIKRLVAAGTVLAGTATGLHLIAKEANPLSEIEFNPYMKMRDYIAVNKMDFLRKAILKAKYSGEGYSFKQYQGFTTRIKVNGMDIENPEKVIQEAIDKHILDIAIGIVYSKEGNFLTQQGYSIYTMNGFVKRFNRLPTEKDDIEVYHDGSFMRIWFTKNEQEDYAVLHINSRINYYCDGMGIVERARWYPVHRVEKELLDINDFDRAMELLDKK